MSTQGRYYISTGDKNCFFTLRYEFDESTPDGGFITRDYYIRNLSIEREQAIAKAREIIGSSLEINFDLDEIRRRSEVDWSVLQNGKHAGTSIHELQNTEEGKQYLCWLCENCATSKGYAKTVELAKALVAHELAKRQEVRDEAKKSEEEKAAKLKEIFAPIEAVLGEKEGGFCGSIAHDLRRGWAPKGRAVPIVIDIYAKSFGRRNSKAYAAAEAQACAIFDQADEIQK